MPEPTTTETPTEARLMAILATAITYSIDTSPGAFQPIDTPPDLAAHAVPGQTFRGAIDAKGVIEDLIIAAVTIVLATGAERREGFIAVTDFVRDAIRHMDPDGCRAGMAEATFRARAAITSRLPDEVKAQAAASGAVQVPFMRLPEDDRPRAGAVTVEDMVDAVGKILGGAGEGGST